MSVFDVVREICSEDSNTMFIAAATIAVKKAQGGAAADLINLIGELLVDLRLGELHLAKGNGYADRDANEDVDDEDEAQMLTGPITKKQRGYIYGLCKKLEIDPHDLQKDVCPWPETRDLTEGQGIRLITKLKKMVEDEGL